MPLDNYFLMRHGFLQTKYHALKGHRQKRVIGVVIGPTEIGSQKTWPLAQHLHQIENKLYEYEIYLNDFLGLWLPANLFCWIIELALKIYINHTSSLAFQGMMLMETNWTVTVLEKIYTFSAKARLELIALHSSVNKRGESYPAYKMYIKLFQKCMIEHLDIACPEFSYFKKHGIGGKKT